MLKPTAGPKIDEDQWWALLTLWAGYEGQAMNFVAATSLMLGKALLLEVLRGIPNGYKSNQQHREFVVWNHLRAQAYPEFLDAWRTMDPQVFALPLITIWFIRQITARAMDGVTLAVID